MPGGELPAYPNLSSLTDDGLFALWSDDGANGLRAGVKALWPRGTAAHWCRLVLPRGPLSGRRIPVEPFPWPIRMTCPNCGCGNTVRP